MIDGIDVSPQRWHGRQGVPGHSHARWHNVVELVSDPMPGINLIGFSSDEGVRRNQGRVGASSGPGELRRALSSLAAPGVRVSDLGDVIVRGEDLAGAQERLGLAVLSVLEIEGLPVVLGGGHEVAFGSYLGWAGMLDAGSDERWGVLNLDAHFDLRDQPEATSGTPFLQIAVAEIGAGRDFNYAVAGVDRASNTRALFDRAAELQVRFLTDDLAEEGHLGEFVVDFLSGVDKVHLSLDLDVLPASVAPGVSAPNGFGLSTACVRTALRLVAQSGKLGLFEVAELNPTHDVGGRTARTAARLIDETLRSTV